MAGKRNCAMARKHHDRLSLHEYELATTIATSARCEGVIEHPVRLQDRAELHAGSSLGAFGFMNVGAIVYRGVRIGRYFSCGRGVEVAVAPHPLTALSTHGFIMNSAWFPLVPGYGVTDQASLETKAHTSIGHDVWLGAQAVIAAGVTVGTGAVVGANSVITKDVDPYDVVAGVPARTIRSRFDAETCQRLLASRWWELPFKEICKLPYRNALSSLELLSKASIGSGGR
jgi:acetyltransferase-like isoleucine patch superfamily enzyme